MSYPRHGGSRHPIADPTGDLRAAFLARLEYDLIPSAGRHTITYRDNDDDATAVVVPEHVSRAYRRKTPR